MILHGCFTVLVSLILVLSYRLTTAPNPNPKPNPNPNWSFILQTDHSTLKMENVRLDGNDAKLGGVIYGLNQSSIYVSNSSAHRNSGVSGADPVIILI